jgi:hypothetical protein
LHSPDHLYDIEHVRDAPLVAAGQSAHHFRLKNGLTMKRSAQLNDL